MHPGGPPVLFSGTLTPRNVRRIVELGDGWIPIMGATRDDIAAGVEVLREAYRAAGRTARRARGSSATGPAALRRPSMRMRCWPTPMICCPSA